MKSRKKLKTIIISLSIFLMVMLGVAIASFYVAEDYIFTKLLESYVEDEIMNDLDIELEDSKSTTSNAETASQLNDGSKGSDDKSTQVGDKPKAITKEEVKKIVKEKAKIINDAIPTKDKVEIKSLILNNLSQGDISYLTGLAADGISKQDITEAKSLARSRFTQEQMAEIYAYYKQYGGAVLK